MRLIELARTGAKLARLFDELSALVEFEDAIVAGAVPFGDEDVAVGSGDDIVRLIEVIGRCSAARLAEGQQNLSVGTEFEDLIPLRRAGPRSDRARRRRCAAAALRRAASSGGP